MDVRIHDILTRAARVAPRAIGATFDTEVRTFAELDAGANRAAHRLAAAGAVPRDRIVWWGESALDAVELGYGISKLGATLAPVNPNFTESEAAASLGILRPRLVVTQPAFEELAREAANACDLSVVVMDASWTAGISADPPPRTGSSEDPCAIFLTSGSTGSPKGALVSHRAAWLRAHQRDNAGCATDSFGVVNMFGLFHMAGWTFIDGAWAANRAVHLVRRPDPQELLGAAERWHASRLYCVPGVWQRILDAGDELDGSSLREVLTGTSQVDVTLLEALKSRFPGSWTSIGYGSTEIGSGTVLPDAELFERPGSVGRPSLMVTADIVGGELYLRGPTLFTGYLDRPDATAEAIDENGWFHTGDLATEDVDGYISITGRASETIRSGGEWVSPVEVESAIITHPSVADVAVVGLPDSSWGEIVCAVIVLQRDASMPSVAELRAHVSGVLVAAKHPRAVLEVAALPRTDATGQIQRRRLRDSVLHGHPRRAD